MTGSQNRDYGDTAPPELNQPTTSASTSFINEVHDYLRERSAQPGNREALRQSNELAFFAGPIPALGMAADRIGPEVIAGHIRNLDSPDFAVRQEATRQLAGLGMQALPEIMAARRNNSSAEVTARCDELISGLLNDQFFNLIDNGLKPADGLSPRDQAIRNATIELLNTMPLPMLLHTLGRHSTDITGERLARLRDALSPQMMQEISLFQHRGHDENAYRHQLGQAMLTNPDRVQRLQGQLAQCLLSSGNRHDAEARRLLENATRQPNCPSAFHAELAALCHRQNDPQAWLNSAGAYMQRVEQEGVDQINLQWSRELESQSFDMLASNQFTAQQRAEVEAIQGRIAEMQNHYRDNPPVMQGN